jgi:hypothetical protein
VVISVGVLLAELCTFTGDTCIGLLILVVPTGRLESFLGLLKRSVQSCRVVISIPQVLFDVVVVNRIASLADAFKNFFINFRLRCGIFCFRRSACKGKRREDEEKMKLR